MRDKTIVGDAAKDDFVWRDRALKAGLVVSGVTLLAQGLRLDDGWMAAMGGLITGAMLVMLVQTLGFARD